MYSFIAATTNAGKAGHRLKYYRFDANFCERRILYLATKCYTRYSVTNSASLHPLKNMAVDRIVIRNF